ncbi:hypothetical protein NONO_c60500 [Nocardia nova SH22a]|uniref:Uncharacterized protein n=1 Tax=Nocardia nova SH22a TaxID=1415166 RepID=W5TUF2_9NOCA|nr:hypothetical protein [Nocardia nova]AHH20826.1 hypothetical protein NONO_c60500 [Nocardia nova SH22a]
MSKTDKTAPFLVKLRCGDLDTVEYHDHRDGTCDLAADPDRFGFAVRGCYKAFHYTGTVVCSCPMCHGLDPRRTAPQRRRRERRTAKQALRAADPAQW